jgi:hypothetical protein
VHAHAAGYPAPMQPVTIAATGGLGNQLFQLAAAVGIADATGRRVRVCCRMYDRPAARRAFVAVRRLVRGLWTDADGRFRLDAMVRRPVLLDLLEEAAETSPGDDRRRGFTRRSLKRAFRDHEARITGALVLRTAGEALEVRDGRVSAGPEVTPLIAGYMQDDRLVAPQLERIRRMVRLPAGTAYLARWMPHAAGDRTVGVHVRRGDYLKPAFRGLMPVLTAGWYERAAHELCARHGELRFLVVSDEPGWARERLRLPGPTTVASLDHPPSAQEDLALLAACGHQVISNSTFGWWGARLGARGGSVVAPTRWLIGQPPDPHLLPGSWIRVENEDDDR